MALLAENAVSAAFRAPPGPWLKTAVPEVITALPGM